MFSKISLTNIQKSINIELNKDGTTSFVLDSISWDSPSVTVHDYRVPKQIGTSLSGVEIGTRTVSIIGYVIPSEKSEPILGMNWNEYYNKKLDDIEQNKYILNRIVNPFHDLMITVGDFYLKGIAISAVRYSEMEEENNEVVCQFAIDISCLSPMFHSRTKKNVSLASVIDKFIFPWELTESNNVMGEISQQRLVDVQNNGDCDVGGIITIKAVGGSVINPKVFNVSTGEYININITLSDGDYITINTKTDEESIMMHDIDGTPNRDYSILSNVLEGSVFIKFKMGSYLYGYTVDESTEANADVSIELEEQYISIKGL